jgi:uncharacterized protein DUF3806
LSSACLSFAGSEDLKTSPLKAGETQWMENQLAIAVAIAESYTGGSEPLPTLERLDATWIAWRGDSSANRVDPNTVVNGLGIAFGRHLIESLGLDWVIATDEYGTDLAVYGEPNAVTFFPANMIAKRLDEPPGPIFTQLHRAATDGVRQLRAKG